MMTTTDETFFAWLDGELEAAEAAEMAARVAADPRLAAIAAQHRSLGARLKGAFDPVAAEPLPARLAASLGAPPTVVDLAAARDRRAAARSWPGVPQWAAMAAALAVGIVVGTAVRPVGEADPVALRGGAMVAAASLDRALDRQLASAPSGEVRVGLTFRDRSGAICRSFSASSASGLACREGEDWRLRGLFAAPEGQSADYRMAAGMDPDLAALVDSSIAGEPLDSAQERAARDKGWR